MFDKATAPPEPGSPREIMFILVWNMRQNIEFHKSRAVLQALMSQKGAEEKTIADAFDILREAFFPFDSNSKKATIKDMRSQMLKEISRGPLSITPLADPGRRKASSRLVQGQGEMARRGEMKKAGALADLDPFDQARRRTRGVS